MSIFHTFGVFNMKRVCDVLDVLGIRHKPHPKHSVLLQIECKDSDEDFRKIQNLKDAVDDL